MKVTLTETKTTEKQLQFEVPQATISAAFDVRLAKVQKQAQIKGFRQGKVPRQIVIQRFGDSIRQEAIQEIIDQSLRSELEKAQIEPVAQPVIIDFADDKEADLKFVASVEIDPAFELADGYADLGVVAETVVLDETEVEKEILELRKRLAEWVTVDRASADGDVVKGEYLYLAIEDESKDLPEKPMFRVEVGATGTPEFDKQLQGLKAGDVKEVKFVFPATYSAEELRGKLATYKLRVDEIQEAKLEDLSDDFAKKVGAESAEDLKAKISENLMKSKETNAQNDAQEKAMDLLLEKNVFDVPEARVANYVMRALNKERITVGELEENRAEAVKAVRRFRILDAISEKEGLKATQEEVDARIQEMAEYYGLPFEDLKGQLRQSGRVVALREELRLDKTLKFIIGIR